MKNQEIRDLAKNGSVRLWQVADRLGINDGSLSRRLRYDLSELERTEIIKIIEVLIQEGKK